MRIDYPFHLNGEGRTALADEESYIRDLIEQILFTAHGERVNRPDFGSSVMQLVFAPNRDQLAAATEAIDFEPRPFEGRDLLKRSAAGYQDDNRREPTDRDSFPRASCLLSSGPIVSHGASSLLVAAGAAVTQVVMAGE